MAVLVDQVNFQLSIFFKFFYKFSEFSSLKVDVKHMVTLIVRDKRAC